MLEKLLDVIQQVAQPRLAQRRDRDGENPAENGAEKSNFALFLQMMAAPQYNGCLFGDVSGMTIRDARSLGYFADIIADPELNGRMFNGSDYPLPAVYFLNPTSELVRKNMLTAAEQEALDAIYGYNPLLFEGMTFDVNTLLYASAAVVIGFQSVVFALFTKIFE